MSGASVSFDYRLLINRVHPHSMSRDGNITVTEMQPDAGLDIWMVQLGKELRPFLVSPFRETQPQLSPDGRFLAYVSDETGRQDVYVQPYPATGERGPSQPKGARARSGRRMARSFFTATVVPSWRSIPRPRLASSRESPGRFSTGITFFLSNRTTHASTTSLRMASDSS